MVIDQSELQEQFRFGGGHLVRMIGWALAAVALLAVFFVFHDQFLALLSHRVASPVRILSIIGVVVLAPLFAYAYGTFMRYLLKLLGME